MSLNIDHIELDQLTSDPATPEDGWIWYRSDLGEIKIRENGTTKSFPKTVESYTWFQDSTSPYIEFKGVSYTVQDRIRFAGTNNRTPTKIYVLYEVDSGSTADIRFYDVTNSLQICEQTGLSSTSWVILDLGTLSNLSAAQSIWELQVLTSAANKNIRISSMHVEY